MYFVRMIFPGRAPQACPRGVRALAGVALCFFGRYLNKISKQRKNRMCRNGNSGMMTDTWKNSD
jgi:hypothetical protein